MGNTISSLCFPNASRTTGLLFLFLALPSTAESSYFNRSDCANRISRNSTNILFLHGSNAQNPIIDKATCLAQCGNQTEAFDDSIPRLNTWFLPILVLLFSLHCSTSGGNSQRRKRIVPSFLNGVEAVAHTLGDPAHYTYCILTRGRVWRRCIQRAQLIADPIDEAYESEVIRIAGILAAFERIHEYVQKNNPKRRWRTGARTRVVEDDTMLRNATAETFRIYAKEYARPIPCRQGVVGNIVGVRTGSIYSVIPAIGLYAWQVVGAFVPTIGQSPNPSGGRVASALLLSWILSAVLCSNTVGDLSCSDGSAIRVSKFLQQKYPDENRAMLQRLVRKSFESSYSCERAKSRCERWGLKLLSAMPVLVAVVFSFTVTVVPPTYITLRIVIPLTIGCGYLTASPALNLLIGRQAIRIKNVLFALANTTVLAVASWGLFFNNCEGWRTLLPRSHAGVVINSDRLFERNDKFLFPLLVSLCIGFQLLYSGFVWWRWSPRISTPTQHVVDATLLRDGEANIISEGPANSYQLSAMVPSQEDLGRPQQYQHGQPGVDFVELRATGGDGGVRAASDEVQHEGA
jgi:hypothetical protein